VSPNIFETIAKRTVSAVVVVAVGCVPFVVLALITGEAAASSWAVFAALTGLLTYLVGGTAIGYLSVGLLTVLVPTAIVVGAVPLAGAGLIAVLCFGAGLSAARGLERECCSSHHSWPV
jgi:hypothetical protein